jgi:ATP-dependent Lhr-like helicase
MQGVPPDFAPATRAWLEAQFEAPTPVQAQGWPLLASRRHALLVAPTGSGKTLAAFLAAIDRLGRLPIDAPPGVRVLYVSPLKALVYDIERNLRAPLEGIAAAAHRLEDAEGPALDPADRFRAPRVGVRTGDTSAKARRQHARDPAEILVTTPESLYLLLGSQARETLRHVETIIVDEIHALAPGKRGSHLMLSLERVARRVVGPDPQRIGLSATARPSAAIARFLGGDREVEVVDTSRRPAIDLVVSVPVPDMTRPGFVSATAVDDEVPRIEVVSGQASSSAERAALMEAEDQDAPDTSLWSAIHPALLEQIRAHRSSILFVNSRALCERLAHRLNELAGEELVRAHHGSLAHAKRKEIEDALADGSLRGLVATSSLELGIDMEAVELVLLVESPGAVSRGLQRIGRAGHAVGAVSRGLIFPKHRGDLLEASVVASEMRRGEVEPVDVPRHPLDVLAQQIVALVAEGPIAISELEQWLRRTGSYAELPRSGLESVLDMLSGRFPSTDFAELRPRLDWDRGRDMLSIREGAARVALLSGGTIPDRGQYAVHVGPDGPRIGELDEEMVHESKPGDVVTLGASSWRVLEITRDRVVVAPAPGEAGRLPFWRGDGPGRPISLGRAIGRFTRLLLEQSDPEAWLRKEQGLDEWAARNLLEYVLEQRDQTGSVPTDRRITIERYRDELGDWRVCILSPFGARIHAPWALAISARLAEQGDFDAQPLWTDDGMMFRFADADRLPARALFLPDPDEIEALVTEQLDASALFATQFRENAARALLLPRMRPGARTPLWVQRLRAQNLQAVARGFRDFPIVLETYRACLQDVFDLPGLAELLAGIRDGEIGVDDVETRGASPFARSIVFAYTATYLYQLDLPAAERRTRALSLDRHLLRELLGAESLRDLLDPEVIDRVEARRQSLDPELAARHAEALHDLLRRLGDLTRNELAARFAGDPADQIEAALASGRWIEIRLGDETRVIAAEEAGLYRDAFGVRLPVGLPAAFLTTVVSPLEQIITRWARNHGPFELPRLAARYGLSVDGLEPLLDGLAVRGVLIKGEFDPRAKGVEWVDAEILRRMKRGTLERLRGEISPVSGEVLARFLIEWHGAGEGREGEVRADEVIDQLEGLPLPFSELERSILPARWPGDAARWLDERGARGELVWIGHRSLGEKDGRVSLYRRTHLAALLEMNDRGGPVAEEAEPLGPIHGSVLERLEARGASFYADLCREIESASSEAIDRALWDLVWAGLITNDTFAPLRALGQRVASPARGRALRRGGRRSRSMRRPLSRADAGRWSLVAPMVGEPASVTERLHARALLVLERHGIVSRESMVVESWPGGFGALYPVLREMEEAGTLRRGHFVEGMTSAQFALPGVVDRLRALREPPATSRAALLSTIDPAQPWGSLLPWPESRRAAARFRRAAGTHVVLVDGRPSLYLDRGGERIICFERDPDDRDAARLRCALRGLVRDASRLGRKRISVEEIDGEKARVSALREAFLDAGFRSGYRGLELEVERDAGSD